jgi:hypothetical protein
MFQEISSHKKGGTMVPEEILNTQRTDETEALTLLPTGMTEQKGWLDQEGAPLPIAFGDDDEDEDVDGEEDNFDDMEDDFDDDFEDEDDDFEDEDDEFEDEEDDYDDDPDYDDDVEE